MKKRLFLFLLASLLLVSLNSFALAQDDLPSGELVVWMQEANQDQIEQTMLDAFYEAYPGITVEFANYAPDEVANQVALTIQGGTGAPDVALMETNQVPRLVALGGGLTDLTEFIEPFADDLIPFALELGARDGAYYAMPWDIGPVVMFYRRDVFEAAGLDSSPEAVAEMTATWEDFLSVCQTINDEAGFPCFAGNRAQNYGDVWVNMVWSAGGSWFEDGALVADSGVNVEALDFLYEFWEADLLSEDLEWTDGWYASLNAQLDGDIPPVATVPIGAWMGGFLKNWAAVDTAGLWGVVPMPAFGTEGVRASNQGGSSYVIPEQSNNQEAAWAFIEFMTSAEAQLAIFEYGDIFPGRISTYEDPIFAEPDEYFAGQSVREIYAEAAQNIPVVNIYGEFYNVMQSNLDVAVQRVALGEESAEDALSEAADIIRMETGLD